MPDATDLHIPGEAEAAVREVVVFVASSERYQEVARTIAAPVVASVLRRLADDLTEDSARIRTALPEKTVDYKPSDYVDLGRALNAGMISLAARVRASGLDGGDTR